MAENCRNYGQKWREGGNLLEFVDASAARERNGATGLVSAGSENTACTALSGQSQLSFQKDDGLPPTSSIQLALTRGNESFAILGNVTEMIREAMLTEA